ncbi:phytoene desaturase [Putridiphycobacter roseus]|uniref:Phytoene desaturase n=1 Tax=Putridiphycobacter roseus TaxID=2219161 RepID=A0A2W1NCH3_9FLAO|nr:phytoene desaturase family protein [Putridiphycobacter roseus]PZE17065.1 phytoene desaturase [Putridiphycobacter roseus]
MTKKIGVIGGGFAGLSAAAYLKKNGYEVVLFEKNDVIGGRNRQFQKDGFVFDMGPSWYWMPDVFEKFFQDFGKTTKDYYALEKLNPAFSIFYDKIKLDIPADPAELPALFESFEEGAGEAFNRFMNSAEYKYEVGMNDFVQKPSKSLLEFASLKVLKGAMKLTLLTKYDKYVREYFKNKYLIQLMEFPVLFLGSAPKNTPALYSLMNYAGLMLGTWYPQGGMHQVVLGMESLIESLGVEVKKSTEITEILVENKRVNGVCLKGGEKVALDGIVAAGDYAHMETLLPVNYRNYTDKYWEDRVFAPSSLLFYLGVDKKIEKLMHHNLFFDESLDQHAVEIYDTPQWPTKPLFYVCVPSKTDDTVAPQGNENIFILMPLAAGVEDTEAIREKYFDIIMDRLEARMEIKIRPHIVYKRSYCINDFKADYYAFKGNAYGLANTLNQTAFLKPKLNNKKIKNMVYAGQLTVPGPGMPPAIISGKLAAQEMEKVVR